MENIAPKEITVSQARLTSVQRGHAIFVTNLAPLIGFLAGIALIPFWGFGWFEAGILALMYTLSVIGLEVGFHRYFSHRAFEAVPGLVRVLAVLGCFCAQGPVIYWVANHRRHHRYSDKPGDPHSPFVDMDDSKFVSFWKGFWHSHLEWQMNHKTPNTSHFAKDLLKDKALFRINRTYFYWVAAGILFPALLGFLYYMDWRGAVLGLIWGGLARIFIVNHVTFSINSICHLYGRQPFNTGEGSRNNALLAIPTFGQAWHNNHHAFPYSAIVGLKKSQIDLGGLCIRMFEALGLATRVKKPSEQQIEQKKIQLNTNS